MSQSAPAVPANSAVDVGLKRMIAVLAALYAVILIACTTIVEGQFDTTDHPVGPVGRDSMNYWSAPALALQDQVASIFDPMRYRPAQETLIGLKLEFHIWSCPPTLLLLMSLAALPYFAALVFRTVVGWAARSRIALDSHWRTTAGLAFILAPAALVNALFGQNGFLTAILFVGGFNLLVTRPVIAGILFGLLTFKPQIRHSDSCGACLCKPVQADPRRGGRRRRLGCGRRIGVRVGGLVGLP